MQLRAGPALQAAPMRASHESVAAGCELRVVVLTTFFPNSSDPHRTVFVRNLVEAMSRGCAIDVIAPIPLRPWRIGRRPVPASEVQCGIRVLHPAFLSVPGLQWLSGCTYFIAALHALRRLRATIGPFVLHAHCAYPDAVGGALAAKVLGVPLVVTVHGSDINVVARKVLLRGQIGWALRSATHVIAVSEALAGRVAALTGHAERIACVPCAGFTPGVFQHRVRAHARTSLGVPADAKIAIYVGQLVPVKGVDVLIRAWAILTSQPANAAARLVLVGAGKEREALAQLAIRERVEHRVSFVGALPQTGVADWLAAADVLCLASRSEGMPNVIVEALASGVPVVASRVGGIPEVVVDGRNGRLVPPDDPAKLAGAVVDALTTTWDRNALRASVAHLTWEHLAERNLQLLRRVAAGYAHALAA